MDDGARPVGERGGPTLVLVHGAGDTGAVWDRLRAAVALPTVAVDLLGRDGRAHDITRVTLAASAEAAVADVHAASTGPWVVVAHSAGAIVAPGIVARLGAVDDLVMVAGLCAPHGVATIDVVDPDRTLGFESQHGPVLERWAGHAHRSRRWRDRDLGGGLRPIDDRRTVQAIDSLVLMFQPVSWDGVPATTRRTWVRCLRDPIQPRPMQARLAAAAGAHRVVDLDAGHTPARDDPGGLAALVERIARGAQRDSW